MSQSVIKTILLWPRRHPRLNRLNGPVPTVNVPAFGIVLVLTVLLVRGVRESSAVNNIMVAIKLGAIIFFLLVGATFVQPANWTFAPSGIGGIVSYGAVIFFTYIGAFDLVSTAAEEAKNPQRDRLQVQISGNPFASRTT